MMLLWVEASLINKLAIIIMAAGKGTRMNTELPKVLHKLNNKTMIEHVIDTTLKINPEKIIVVIGYKSELIKKQLNDYNIEYAEQLEQLGTGHAIMQCQNILNDFKGDTLILSGDVPLITKKTLSDLYKKHIEYKSKGTILSAIINNPTGYGRILRDKNSFISIVEEKDANEKQKKINEVNTGIYIFNNQILFSNINQINNHNNQSEYYLPDVLPIILKNKHQITVCKTSNELEIKGINTIQQLYDLEKQI